MTHEPIVLDGVNAAKKLVAKGKVVAGQCLAEVDKAFGSPRSDRHYGLYANANLALRRARELGALRAAPVSEAPEGAILYYSYGALGHIALKGAGGKVATIDYPTRGRSALVDPRAMARGWPSVKYVGFAAGAGAFLGNTVTVAGAVHNSPGAAPNQQAILNALLARGYRVPNNGLYNEAAQRAVLAFCALRSVNIRPRRQVDAEVWAHLRIAEDSKKGIQTVRGVQAALKIKVDGVNRPGAQTDQATQRAWGFTLSGANPGQVLRAQRAVNAGSV